MTRYPSDDLPDGIDLLSYIYKQAENFNCHYTYHLMLSLLYDTSQPYLRSVLSVGVMWTTRCILLIWEWNVAFVIYSQWHSPYIDQVWSILPALELLRLDWLRRRPFTGRVTSQWGATQNAGKMDLALIPLLPDALSVSRSGITLPYVHVGDSCGGLTSPFFGRFSRGQLLKRPLHGQIFSNM